MPPDFFGFSATAKERLAGVPSLVFSVGGSWLHSKLWFSILVLFICVQGCTVIRNEILGQIKCQISADALKIRVVSTKQITAHGIKMIFKKHTLIKGKSIFLIISKLRMCERLLKALIIRSYSETNPAEKPMSIIYHKMKIKSLCILNSSSIVLSYLVRFHSEEYWAQKKIKFLRGLEFYKMAEWEIILKVGSLTFRSGKRTVFCWILLDLLVYISVSLVKWDELLINIEYFREKKKNRNPHL